MVDGAPCTGRSPLVRVPAAFLAILAVAGTKHVRKIRSTAETTPFLSRRANMRYRNSLIAGLCCGGILLGARSVHAFVETPVGGRPGDVDLSFRAGFERGKVEPNEFSGSWQKARWNTYSLSLGYTVGAAGPLDDLFIRFQTTHYRSPAETSSPSDLLNPETGAVAPADCRGRVLAGGVCEFHPEDNGWLLTPSVGAKLVHTPRYALAVFLQGTIPVGVDLGKFVLPRVDYVAGGIDVGVRLTSWLSYTSRIFVGSGASRGDDKQNSAVALTNLFRLEAERWLLPWKIGVSVGPYFEGDLSERFDDTYDAAYTSGYPQRRDRIRSAKFGTAILPFVQVTNHAVLNLGYVQKFFGYDAPATQFYYAGATAVF